MIHGRTNEILAGEPSQECVIPELKAFIDGLEAVYLRVFSALLEGIYMHRTLTDAMMAEEILIMMAKNDSVALSKGKTEKE